MKKYTLFMIGIIMSIYSTSYTQIGEFEGDVQISDGTATLLLYDTNDSFIKGRLREFQSNILLESLRGDLRFGVGTTGSPTTRMTIDGASGNIGIGTTAPSAELDIRHDSGLNSAHLELDETTPDDYSRIKFINSGSAGNDFWDVAGRANGNNAIVAGAASSQLNFYYKFKDGGPGHDYLSIVPFNLFGERIALFKFRGNLNPVKDDLYSVGAPGVRWNVIYATNGTIQTSDIRMKKNIDQLTYGLDDLLKLKPVSYEWKNSKDQKVKLGLIAQEVLKVIPEAVHDTKTVVNKETGLSEQKEAELMGMDYTSLIPVLIQSIQEQQAQIEDLKAEIEILKTDK